LQELLSLDPARRIDTRGFMTSDYFNDIHLRSMAFLSNLMEKENAAKAAFFKGFYNILETFTPRIIESKVLPPLLQELKNEIQLPFVVPIVMELSKKLTPRKFQTIVFPFMIPLFNIELASRNPTLGPLLVQNLDFFISKIPNNVVEQSKAVFIDFEFIFMLFKKQIDVLPFLYQLLDSNSSKLQDLAIRKIPDIANSIDYLTFKSV
jgi:SCY1-like protein 2